MHRNFRRPPPDPFALAAVLAGHFPGPEPTLTVTGRVTMRFLKCGTLVCSSAGIAADLLFLNSLFLFCNGSGSIHGGILYNAAQVAACQHARVHAAARQSLFGSDLRDRLSKAKRAQALVRVAVKRVDICQKEGLSAASE